MGWQGTLWWMEWSRVIRGLPQWQCSEYATICQYHALPYLGTKPCHGNVWRNINMPEASISCEQEQSRCLCLCQHQNINIIVNFNLRGLCNRMTVKYVIWWRKTLIYMMRLWCPRQYSSGTNCLMTPSLLDTRLQWKCFSFSSQIMMGRNRL